jgi:hypothetical protein
MHHSVQSFAKVHHFPTHLKNKEKNLGQAKEKLVGQALAQWYSFNSPANR